jgi:hypothetical protein
MKNAELFRNGQTKPEVLKGKKRVIKSQGKGMKRFG